MKGSWTAAITDELLRLKRSGWARDDFAGAWRVAVRRYPPRGRDTSAADGTFVAFTRRVC